MIHLFFLTIKTKELSFLNWFNSWIIFMFFLFVFGCFQLNGKMLILLRFVLKLNEKIQFKLMKNINNNKYYTYPFLIWVGIKFGSPLFIFVIVFWNGQNNWRIRTTHGLFEGLSLFIIQLLCINLIIVKLPQTFTRCKIPGTKNLIEYLLNIYLECSWFLIQLIQLII